MTKRNKDDLAQYYGWEPGDIKVTSPSGEEIDATMPEVTDEQKAAVEAAIAAASEDRARGARELAKAGQWPAAADWLDLDIF